MKPYGKLSTSFWSNAKIQKLNDDARILAIYLITGPTTNLIGGLQFYSGMISDALNWQPQRVQDAMILLLDSGFISYDRFFKYLWIKDFLLLNPLENPNQGKAALKLVDSIPVEICFYNEMIEKMLEIAPKYADFSVFRGKGVIPYETVTKPSTSIISFPSEPSKKEKKQPRQAPEYSDNFLQAYSIYPKRDGDNPKRKAWQAWNARLKEGRTEEEMIAGVQRYWNWCNANNLINTQSIKHAATFFGPDKPFLEPWTIIQTKNTTQVAISGALDIFAQRRQNNERVVSGHDAR